MKRIVALTLKTVGGLFAAIVLLLLVAGILLNTDAFQNKLLGYATRLLSEKLNTEVKIDHVSIGLFSNSMELEGLSVEDLEHRKMLEMERLTVSMDMWALLKKEVRITSAHVVGLSAELYKSADGAANYQFVIDAFKDPVLQEQEQEEKDELTLNVKKVVLERISLKYNESTVQLARLEYREKLGERREARLEGLDVLWIAHLRRGAQDCKAGIGILELQQKDKNGQIAVGNLYFWSDNHLPRKNKGNPEHGAFDNGHMDMKANLKISFTEPENNKLTARIEHCEVNDSTAGIHVKELTLGLTATKEKLWMENIVVSLANTTIKIDSAAIQLPSKARGVALAYKASLITGQTLLKDISKPFAPVLSKFSLPIKLSARMSGDENAISFTDIRVATPDRKLQVSATGVIRELEDKYKLDARFHVDRMLAKGDIKERIINQFPVKKFMMKQLAALGDISYKGDIFVRWRRERFMGVLNTAVGKLDFSFGINENTEYVSGTVSTAGIDIGRVFNLKDLGPVSCSADFDFDISKPRTARMRRLKGGKLPIGSVKAQVNEASYKKIKFRNILTDIVSDGAVAEGKLTVKGKHADVLGFFSFTNTDSIKSKLKVKPGIRFHGLSGKDKKDNKRKKD